MPQPVMPRLPPLERRNSFMTKMAHELWFDADGVGAGAPVELAVLNNGNFANSLFGTDFVVI